MGKYRAGIIGCGGIGRKHANAYAQMTNVDLFAGADPSDRREVECREIGIQRFYRDALEMLSREDLDLVSVCTNPSQHASDKYHFELKGEGYGHSDVCSISVMPTSLAYDMDTDGYQYPEGIEVANERFLGKGYGRALRRGM